MNEVFLTNAKELKIPVEIMCLYGGHTFPMVEKSLPAALTFLEGKIGETSGR